MTPEDSAVARACMSMASALLAAMSDSGRLYADVDAMCSKPSGWARRKVRRLADGKSVKINDASAIAYACGCVLIPSSKPAIAAVEGRDG